MYVCCVKLLNAREALESQLLSLKLGRFVCFADPGGLPAGQTVPLQPLIHQSMKSITFHQALNTVSQQYGRPDTRIDYA